jgi:hypothetical protein
MTISHPYCDNSVIPCRRYQGSVRSPVQATLTDAHRRPIDLRQIAACWLTAVRSRSDRRRPGRAGPAAFSLDIDVPLRCTLLDGFRPDPR